MIPKPHAHVTERAWSPRVTEWFNACEACGLTLRQIIEQGADALCWQPLPHWAVSDPVDAVVGRGRPAVSAPGYGLESDPRGEPHDWELESLAPAR